jgi:hypothetical protein
MRASAAAIVVLPEPPLPTVAIFMAFAPLVDGRDVVLIGAHS